MSFNQLNLPSLSSDKKVMIVLSGGLDSTIMMRVAVARYGADNIIAVSYHYGQKQSLELEKAKQSCNALNVKHQVLDLGLLGQLTANTSTNIKGSASFVEASDATADRPSTYVPFRNLILFSLTLAAAESNQVEHIFSGLQIHDEYNYWDSSAEFIKRLNHLCELNDGPKITIHAPFAMLSKAQEIKLLLELDGQLDLLKSTLTCYEPVGEKSCARCPSCKERLNAFKQLGLEDVIEYI